MHVALTNWSNQKRHLFCQLMVGQEEDGKCVDEIHITQPNTENAKILTSAYKKTKAQLQQFLLTKKV